MELANHFITKCSTCGAVIAQCRCPDLNKAVNYAVCDACRKKRE